MLIDHFNQILFYVIVTFSNYSKIEPYTIRPGNNQGRAMRIARLALRLKRIIKSVSCFLQSFVSCLIGNTHIFTKIKFASVRCASL